MNLQEQRHAAVDDHQSPSRVIRELRDTVDRTRLFNTAGGISTEYAGERNEGSWRIVLNGGFLDSPNSDLPCTLSRTALNPPQFGYGQDYTATVEGAEVYKGADYRRAILAIAERTEARGNSFLELAAPNPRHLAYSLRRDADGEVTINKIKLFALAEGHALLRREEDLRNSTDGRLLQIALPLFEDRLMRAEPSPMDFKDESFVRNARALVSDPLARRIFNLLAEQPAEGSVSMDDYIEQVWQVLVVSRSLAATNEIFRDIFRNPLKEPIVFLPEWQTQTAVALADAIRAGNAFDRMPILADALEEAGCDNAEVLAHCRSNQTHARGCWVVDAVLSRNSG